MRKYHCCCIRLEHNFCNLPWIHACTIDGATKQRLETYQPMLLIEQQDPKNLMLKMSQIQSTILLNFFWIGRLERLSFVKPCQNGSDPSSIPWIISPAVWSWRIPDQYGEYTPHWGGLQINNQTRNKQRSLLMIGPFHADQYPTANDL